MIVDIRGLPELQGKLNKLQDKVQKTIVKTALTEANKEIVLPAVIFNAPSKSGTLISQLKIISSSSKKAIRSKVVSVAHTEDGEGYSAFQDLGTKHQHDTEFMRKAIHDNKESILDVITEKIGKDIEAI